MVAVAAGVVVWSSFIIAWKGIARNSHSLYQRLRTGLILHNFLGAVLPQYENLHNFSIYAVLLGLTQFAIDSMWLHLSSVGGQQKVTTLSLDQSHVYIYDVSDIIVCHMLFPLQQHWHFLPTCL
jgi:hypothetical protein